MNLKKVLIIAGGTGGHIFPALAIADALKVNGVDVCWLGASVGMEKKLVGSQYPLHLLPIQAIRGGGILRKLLAPGRILRSVYLAMQHIRQINPDFVIGMGGYASGPGGIAAVLLRKPLAIHEQNAVAGLTNRILSRCASLVFQAFPKAFERQLPAITVGNPVRSVLTALPDPAARFAMRSAGSLNVLVLGGSQGARAINQVIEGVLALLSPESAILFWHQSGVRDLPGISAAYTDHPEFCHHATAFIQEMAAAYAWADLVICRAGALTVSELSAVGLPAILVPYPHAVDDHQTANAQRLSDQGAAILLKEDDLTPHALSKLLLSFCQDKNRLLDMAESAAALAVNDSAERIISACEQFLISKK